MHLPIEHLSSAMANNALPAPAHFPRVLLSSADRDWRDLEAALLHIPPGLSRVPGREVHRVGIHLSAPVKATCACDGRSVSRIQKPGDMDIVPAGMDGSWEDDAECRILSLGLPQSLLSRVAEDLGARMEPVQIVPEFQLRDTRIEAIGWAIKADLESSIPSDPLYIDLLAQALAVRLIETASGRSRQPGDRTEPRLSQRQLARLTDFIESNLGRKLGLMELAREAGVSGTRFKTLFRNSTGVPVHQYVIRRRVDYARALLSSTGMSASEVALAAGFSHQSHMSSTLRRVLGQTPGEIARSARKFGPNSKAPV